MPAISPWRTTKVVWYIQAVLFVKDKLPAVNWEIVYGTRGSGDSAVHEGNQLERAAYHQSMRETAITCWLPYAGRAMLAARRESAMRALLARQTPMAGDTSALELRRRVAWTSTQVGMDRSFRPNC